ncbi:MAG: CBS domain-containing protein [Bdellovibrionales bacterium]|nr:CBS domain-containing protein [Bdellovibrionales bacterium]
MNKYTKVSQVMTPIKYTIAPFDTLAQAKTLMYRHGIRHLPVVDHEELVGLLTDRDLKLTLSVVAEPSAEDTIKVEAACISHPYVVDGEALLVDILKEMRERHIGSAIVRNERALAGIFTTSDACSLLAECLRNLD